MPEAALGAHKLRCDVSDVILDKGEFSTARLIAPGVSIPEQRAERVYECEGDWVKGAG